MPTATGASSLNAFTTPAPLRSPIALAASHARRFRSLEGALAKTKRHLVEGGTLYAISDVKRECTVINRAQCSTVYRGS